MERDFSPMEETRPGPVGVPEFPEPLPRQDRYSSPGLEPRFEPRFGEPVSMESPVEKEPISMERTDDKYEIMDRLNIIEAQLTAIRSQTETINERLKNMEMRIGRRY
jgi:hypothetical protein